MLPIRFIDQMEINLFAVIDSYNERGVYFVVLELSLSINVFLICVYFVFANKSNLQETKLFIVAC